MDKYKEAKNFCNEVKEISKKYNLSFFLVTEGASVIVNRDCPAVRAARIAHMQWEKNHKEE